SLGEERASDGTPCGITGVIEYASDLFDRGSVAALGRRLERLLAAAVARPDASIGSLEILAGSERRQLLGGLDATSHLAGGGGLPELCAAEAPGTPGAGAGAVRGQRPGYGGPGA